MRSNILLILMVLLAACKVPSIPKSAYVIEMEEYRQAEQIKLSSAGGPLTESSVDGIAYYTPDETYKVTAKFQKIKADSVTVIPTYSGKNKDYIEFANLSFSIAGQQQQLKAFKGLQAMRMPQYKNKLFIMFKDLTNGESSYGGGRYIYIDESKIEGNTLEIDFNKSFNPYCAYTDGYNCPIPPPENHLPIVIKAGEKAFNRH